MESNPLERERVRESAVFERAVRFDIQADLDRMRSQLVRAEQQVNGLKQDIKMLESAIAEYEWLDRQTATTD